MYRAVIFDFDYTLGDTTQSIVASVNYALERLGYLPHGVEEIRSTVGLSLDETFRVLTGEADSEKEARFFDYFQIKADEVMTADARLFDRVEELLKKWSARYRVCIFSTKHRFRIADILNKFSIGGYVNAIVGNEDVEYEKPHPDGLFKALSLLGAEPREALYVGDSVVDAEAAARAGTDFAAVLTGTTRREAFARFPSVAICEDLSGIEAFLEAE